MTSGRKGTVNKKLVRRFGGNTKLIPDHLLETYWRAEDTVVKENGVVYRRPHQMHDHVLASDRCITAFRRGR